MRERVVLIGAGSAMFTRGLVADLLDRGWDGELALVDIDPTALRVAEGLARKMLQARKSKLRLIAAEDRREVLTGATAVICTIGVGGRRAWEQDVFIPRKYGIFQPVGDSVMPGGTSRALRMIPPMVAIAQDVLDLCPQALFFNYGNPMSAVCRAVRKATGAPVVGLCHGVFHIGKHIANLLQVAPARMRYAAVGINHLTWFTDIRIDGQDAMPKLRELAQHHLGIDRDLTTLGTHFAEAGNAPRDESIASESIVTWEFVDLFNAYPAVGDRHITEFFPHLYGREGAYFGKTLGVDGYRFEDTIAWGDKIYAEMQEQAESPAPLPADYFERIGGEHEQVLDIIDSIRNERGTVYSANLPNQGQVPNFPMDAVIEGPAYADASGLHAIAQAPVSPAICGTLATRFQWVETVVEAALEGSREKFVQALLLDGAVHSVDQAWRLADDLIKAQQEYLPQF